MRQPFSKWRSRADLNRCTSFCRALPNRSATRPEFETLNELPSIFSFKEREKNNFTLLTGYFVLILHFKSLKISTFMRVSKPKLRTNSFSRESKFIYFAFLSGRKYKLLL